MENYNNPDIAKLNMETSKRLAESMKGWDGTNSMSNPVNGSYSTGATAQMLKEACSCDDKRIGKERISVFVVKQFDKKTDDYNQKELKPKDIF